MEANPSAKYSVAIALAIVLGLSFAPLARGASEDERHSLAGLPGVRVLVEDMDPDAERDGLTKTLLQTDVELRLRQAGVRVLTSSGPYLYLNVNTTKSHKMGLYAYSTQLEVRQTVRLDRNPSIVVVLVPTWSAQGGSVGMVGEKRLRQIRDFIRDLIDEFINDYLAANPKQ